MFSSYQQRGWKQHDSSNQIKPKPPLAEMQKQLPRSDGGRRPPQESSRATVRKNASLLSHGTMSPDELEQYHAAGIPEEPNTGILPDYIKQTHKEDSGGKTSTYKRFNPADDSGFGAAG